MALCSGTGKRGSGNGWGDVELKIGVLMAGLGTSLCGAESQDLGGIDLAVCFGNSPHHVDQYSLKIPRAAATDGCRSG